VSLISGATHFWEAYGATSRENLGKEAWWEGDSIPESQRTPRENNSTIKIGSTKLIGLFTRTVL